MSKRAKITVRVIGGVLLLIPIIVGLISLQDQFINGLEVATLSLASVGIYLLFASERSLMSWVMK